MNTQNPKSEQKRTAQVRVRLALYNYLRKIAFDRRMKIGEVLENLLENKISIEK